MALPALASSALSTGTSLLGGLPVVGGIFQSEDPVKNAERKRIIDALAAEALRSGKTSEAYIHLACWAGASTGSADYNNALALGFVLPGQPCRVGSDSMLVYAKARKLEVDARLAGGRLLTGTGVTLIGAGDELAPGTISRTIREAIPTPVLLAAGAVVLFLLLRR